MASDPDPDDALNDFSLQEFNKPLHQLTPEERDLLLDLAREKAAQGGRIGYRDGTSADWIQRNRLREIEGDLPLSRRAPITKSPHTSEEGIESILQRYAIAVQKLKDRYGSDWRAKREELSDEGINMADVLYGNEYAQGGRIGYNIGGITGEQNSMVTDMLNKGMDISTISTITNITEDQIKMIINQINEAQKGLEESGALENVDLKAQGGRIGYGKGGDVMKGIEMGLSPEQSLDAWKAWKNLKDEGYEMSFSDYLYGEMFSQGGRVGAEEGGLMNLGGMEKDYRQEGGFVPIGGREKADDVPARLSKNEFVFTADAVRNAGGGDIDAGAEVMENLMEHLEAGGKVSEDSQGLEGAQEMFANTQRLQNRII